MPVIEVEKLVREYRVAPKHFHPLKVLFGKGFEVRRAVDSVSFSIEKGELVGYIGPNGAGKSTTIKILAGILVPTSGRVAVLGRVPHEQRVRNASQIGAVFGQRSQLWWELRVRDTFELLRRIYRLPQQRYERSLKQLTALLDLGPILPGLARQLSLGQRMRADLAAALLHEPEILFLDEPTIGLDIVAKEEMRRFIRQLRAERGVTVLLTTHDMRDIEEICQRIIMIDKGRIVFDLPAVALMASYGALRTLTVVFECERGGFDIPGVQVERIESGRWSFTFDRGVVGVHELIRRIGELCPIRDFSLADPNLEHIMRDVYQGRTSVHAQLPGR